MFDNRHFIQMLERINTNRQQYNIIEINNAIHQVETHYKSAHIKKTTLRHFIHTFDYSTLFDTGFNQFISILKQIEADES